MIKPDDSCSLTYRGLANSDAVLLYGEAFGDGKTMRYLQWDTHTTLEESKELVAEMVVMHEKGEKFLWIGIDQEKDKPVGLGSIRPDGDVAWIGIFVLKSEIRKGFGRKMLSALESSVHQHFSSAFAEVHEKNIGSSALFESAGWRINPDMSKPNCKYYRKDRSQQIVAHNSDGSPVSM